MSKKEEKSALEIFESHNEQEHFSSLYERSVFHMLERAYNSNIIKKYGICGLFPDPTTSKDMSQKMIVKWYKRLYPLTDEQYKESYGTSN